MRLAAAAPTHDHPEVVQVPCRALTLRRAEVRHDGSGTRQKCPLRTGTFPQVAHTDHVPVRVDAVAFAAAAAERPEIFDCPSGAGAPSDGVTCSVWLLAGECC